MFLPQSEKEQITALRGVLITAGVLIIAYALFGFLSDEIAVFSGKGRGAGTQYVHGEQVVLAALGYVSLAKGGALAVGVIIMLQGLVGLMAPDAFANLVRAFMLRR